MRSRAGSARPGLADMRKELAGSIVDRDASLAGARCAGELLRKGGKGVSFERAAA
jgi:hypothetical protein